MKRDIKFRAWNTFDRHLVHDIIFLRNKDFTLNKFLGEDRYVLMQYTGLKDKNGKEIYEGDVLKSGVQIVTVVYTAESASFDLMTNTKGLMGMAGVNSILGIIGNIYENPELLEEKND